MISTQAAANTFLEMAFEEKIDVSPMKLQKLLYFANKRYLKDANEPLFAEAFQPWKYGPVLNSVYYEFQSYRAEPIKRFARDASDNVYLLNRDCGDEVLINAFDETWRKYKNRTGIELSKLTHKEGSAWEKAVQNKYTELRDEDIQNEE